MPLCVLTGAPGVGKTTVLAELAARGHRTVAESAREVIVERRAAGLPPRPAPAEFARAIHRRDVLKLHAVAGATDWVFFDRSAVESLGMLHEAGVLTDHDLREQLRDLSFHRTVFLLPVWPEIYRIDAERDHSLGHAWRVHASIERWYAACGYSLEVIPRGSPAERADFILDTLNRAA